MEKTYFNGKFINSGDYTAKKREQYYYLNWANEYFELHELLFVKMRQRS